MNERFCCITCGRKKGECCCVPAEMTATRGHAYEKVAPPASAHETSEHTHGIDGCEVCLSSGANVAPPAPAGELTREEVDSLLTSGMLTYDEAEGIRAYIAALRARADAWHMTAHDINVHQETVKQQRDAAEKDFYALAWEASKLARDEHQALCEQDGYNSTDSEWRDECDPWAAIRDGIKHRDAAEQERQRLEVDRDSWKREALKCLDALKSRAVLAPDVKAVLDSLEEVP